MNIYEGSEHKLYTDIDTLGLPRVPVIPKIVLCLNFPGSDGWNSHWAEFNKQVKEFHQAMIDFNCRIMEWYFLKSRQLERFGRKTSYIAGTVLTGPRTTVIYAKIINDCDAMTEIRKCLPGGVEEDIKHIERTGYKLFLTGKIFIFNDERAIAIDYDNDSQTDENLYKNCLKFSLYHKNEKISIGESYKRVYGGLKFSFLVGGIGGALASFLTEYFNKPTTFSPRFCEEKSLLWFLIRRFITSAACYSFVERILLLKFSSPEKYILSGSAGAICGSFFGFCDNCKANEIIFRATEFGIFSLVCNLFADKRYPKRIGSNNESNTFPYFKQYKIIK